MHVCMCMYVCMYIDAKASTFINRERTHTLHRLGNTFYDAFHEYKVIDFLQL